MTMYLNENGLMWAPEDVEVYAGADDRIAAGETSSEQAREWIESRTRKA